MENSSDSKPTTIEFNVDRRCPIQYITVYNDRAEVTRSVQYHFNVQGTYDLVFEGFSPSVDLTSLHVSGGTGKACTILEVSYQTRHEEVKLDTELKPLDQLRNELDQIQKNLDKHQQELARLVKQRTWLDGRATKLMNHDEKLSGSNDLDVMQQFLEFYYKNLTKLDEETTNEQNHIKQLTQEKDGFEAKISQYGAEGEAHRQKIKREVTVTVHIASDNVDIALEISYLISNCSWRASYDVRVNSTELEQQKTQLTYYGIIVNQSQENWSNVQLSLSTAKPSLGGAPPKLATLRIGYEIPRYDYRRENFAGFGGSFGAPMLMCAKKSRPSSMMRAFTSLGSSSFNEQEESTASPTINVLAAETEASMSSSSFSIPRRATIDADGKPHKVTIGVLDLSSTFTYTIIPKLSLHAYLKATTTNTSDKQLLAGPAAVFMDNNFIAHSSIDNVCLGDTFDLPLGMDASIKVEYKPVKKVTDTQGLISKINCENIYHETRVVNTKATDVTVYIYEQVPLSSDEKIRVKLLIPDLRLKEQASNCTVTMNDANNVEWKWILQPKGECRCPLNYTVDWPKDKRVEYKEA
ncbi:unnamed protein product [Adineta ricciae]|uniref:Protein F37C4.5 n=1 Tax=Adineta ricciae TaxID=249248 RepID=A0A815BQV6_ADIRI|nr:unnamed protein product [Adineta ricciae]CAF1272895.1 unnamed protein product [Adineta ricciae]